MLGRLMKRGEEGARWAVEELPYQRVVLPNGRVIRAVRIVEFGSRRVVYVDPSGRVRVETW